jgi:hypothetical protein
MSRTSTRAISRAGQMPWGPLLIAATWRESSPLRTSTARVRMTAWFAWSCGRCAVDSDGFKFWLLIVAVLVAGTVHGFLEAMWRLVVGEKGEAHVR